MPPGCHDPPALHMLALLPFLYPCHDPDLGDWYWPQNLKPDNYGISDSQKVPGGLMYNPDISTPKGGTDADIVAETRVYTTEAAV